MPISRMFHIYNKINNIFLKFHHSLLKMPKNLMNYFITKQTVFFVSFRDLGH